MTSGFTLSAGGAGCRYRCHYARATIAVLIITIIKRDKYYNPGGGNHLVFSCGISAYVSGGREPSQLYEEILRLNSEADPASGLADRVTRFDLLYKSIRFFDACTLLDSIPKQIVIETRDLDKI